MKKWILVLAVLVTVGGMAFAHSRPEIEKFIKKYESAVDDLVTGIDYLVRNPNNANGEKRLEAAQDKMTEIKWTASDYVGELTQADIARVQRANERVNKAGAKLENFKRKKGY